MASGDRLQVCGPLALTVGGMRIEERLPGPQGRRLFLFLAVNRNRDVSRGEATVAVWGDDPPPAPDAALNALVSKIRRVIGTDTLSGRTSLRLRLPDDAWIDLEAARSALHDAESFVAQESWTRAWGPARVAQTIADRGFLDDVDLPWAEEVRTELGQTLLRGLDCIAASGLGIGGAEIGAAERAARRLIRLAPLRESGHRHLMRVLAARGENAEALLVYDALCRRLRDELGVSPSPASRALHQELVNADA